MDTQNNFQSNRRGGAAVFGGLLIIAGVIFMLRQFGVVSFNFKIWPLFLIGAGVFSGIKHRFRNMSAYVLIFIGLIFMIPEFTVMGQPSSKLIWPLALILGGAMVLLRPKNRCRDGFPNRPFQKPGHWESAASVTEAGHPSSRGKNGLLNIDAIFGGRKEIITSKSFAGANIAAICGGIELNLMQAEAEVQPMILEVKAICGGLEVIIPSHWEVVNELDVLFGGIEDKRYIRTTPESGVPKTLVLRGSVTFAGVEIKSY